MSEFLTPYFLLAGLSAYLLGSIPTAVWVGRMFYGIDVREHGSGNAGATNTFRVLGKKAGIPVLIIDIIKGWAPVFFLPWLSPLEPGSAHWENFQLVLGVLAVLGHVFPVFAGFRGGKGIATLLGVLLALHLFAALACIGIFLVTFVSSRIVSVGSMSAAIAFPLLVAVVFKNENPVVIGFSILVTVAVIVTHRKNIGRLLRHEESKMNIGLRSRGRK